MNPARLKKPKLVPGALLLAAALCFGAAHLAQAGATNTPAARWSATNPYLRSTNRLDPAYSALRPTRIVLTNRVPVIIPTEGTPSGSLRKRRVTALPNVVSETQYQPGAASPLRDSPRQVSRPQSGGNIAVQTQYSPRPSAPNPTR